MRNKWKFAILLGAIVLASSTYLFYELGGSYDYALPRRAIKLLAMVITAVAIAYATVTFQTITHNRILTPSIIGLDSLYMLVQTFIVFFLSATHVLIASKVANFLVSVLMMIGFALLLYQLFFHKKKYPIYFLLLVGVIIGTFFQSISTFLQVLIDPNEFMRVQDRMFASFQNVNGDLVWVALVIIGLVVAWGTRSLNQLDVMSLGRDTAVNLGVPYDGIVRKVLIQVAILISVSTALVGPIMFFGLIVANLAYQMFPTYKHKTLLSGAVAISILALIGGQWLVERVFTFSTTLSVIINFIGGVYFIYLLLKESRKG